MSRHAAIRFERGERVKVMSDERPRPVYIIVGVDPVNSVAILSQIGTGFRRTVQLSILQSELIA